MSDLKIWMGRRKLKLNDGKTEIIVIRGNLRNVSVANLGEMSFGDTQLVSYESAKNLGVVLNSSLSFRYHIDSIVKTCNFHIRNLYMIYMIKDFVNRKNLATLVHSLIISKVDYCNGVFGNLPSHQMAVAIMYLIGKEIREIHFGHRALPYILCAYKYIQCL